MNYRRVNKRCTADFCSCKVGISALHGGQTRSHWPEANVSPENARKLLGCALALRVSLSAALSQGSSRKFSPVFSGRASKISEERRVGKVCESCGLHSQTKQTAKALKLDIAR